MQRFLWSLGMVSLVLAFGCGDGQGGKDDPDGGDWCEQEGRYADGHCDQCPQGDPDCDSVDPCYGRYGDGTCDTECFHPDPDCDATDPCALDGRYTNGVCDLDCFAPDPECDAGPDRCAEQGLYGDGSCDACFDFDPDCQSLPVDPCEATAYGNGTCEACRHYDPDCDPLPLGPPQDLQATDGTFLDRVAISWTPLPGAVIYKVYRATSETAASTYLADVWATRDLGERPSGGGSWGEAHEQFDDTTATPGETHWYEVTAVDFEGETGPSLRDAGAMAVADPSLLGPPQNVRALAIGPGTISLLWDGVPGATFYQVYAASAVSGLAEPTALQGGTSETGWSLNVNYPGVEFWFGVTALATSGGAEGPMSTPVSATMENASTLPAPQNLVASQDLVDRIEFSWDLVAGADFYRITHLSTGGGSFHTPVSGDLTGTTHSYAGPLADTYGYYQVRAFSSAGEASDFSTTATGIAALLPAPSGLVATPTGAASIQLDWDLLPEAASYVVLRGTPGGPVDQEIASPTSPGLEDTGLAADTEYAYQVVGVAASGRRGAATASVLASTLPSLFPPATLTATTDLLDRVTLSWSAVGNATAYRLYRDDAGWVQIGGDLTGTSTDDLPELARLDQSLSYRITSVDAVGESAPSATATGMALRITAPTGQAVTTESTPTDTRPDTGIVVSWQPVAEAIEYRFYRAGTSAPAAVVGSAGAADTEWYDSNVALGYHYFYQVVAVSPAGHESSRLGHPSVVGNTDPGWVLNNGSPMLGPTSVVNSYVVGTDSFDLAWTNVTGAGSYHVSREGMDCSGGPCISTGNSLGLGEVTGTTYSDTAAPTDAPCYRYLISPVAVSGLWSIFARSSNVVCRP